jgi:cation transport regulator ChaB
MNEFANLIDALSKAWSVYKNAFEENRRAQGKERCAAHRIAESKWKDVSKQEGAIIHFFNRAFPNRDFL